MEPITLREAMEWLRRGAPPRAEIEPRVGRAESIPDVRESICNHLAREDWVEMVSYAIPCQEVVDYLTQTPLLEIGAGTGYWAALLCKAGGDVIATDVLGNGETSRYRQNVGIYHPVLRSNAAHAVRSHAERDVLCIWPCYRSRWIVPALKMARPGVRVHIIGEGVGGATGSDRMFDMLRSDFTEERRMSIPTWRGVHDHLTTYIVGESHERSITA